MKMFMLKLGLLVLILLVVMTAWPPATTQPDTPSSAVVTAALGPSVTRDEVRERTTLRASRSRALRRSIQRTQPPAPRKSTAVSPHVPHVHAPRTAGASSLFSNLEMRVRSCESGARGWGSHGHAHDFNYTAENPSSSASGAWQFVDGTWAGFMGYAHAASAPRWVQDLKARRYIDANGLGAWNASRSCWGT